VFYVKAECPSCRSGPVGFVSDGRTVVLWCEECAACFPAPNHVDLEHAMYPDSQGLVSGHGVTACVDKSVRRDARIEEVEAAGWRSAVAGEWTG
jgi:hypothetical protein